MESRCAHAGIKGGWPGQIRCSNIMATSLVPRPSLKIRARVNACAREEEKGLVNNYASPQAKAMGQRAGRLHITIH